jgi:hypothetical protein
LLPSGRTLRSCNAQQLDLQRRRHIANLVEEQRAAFRGLEQPFPAADRAGKGAARMTKQFGLQQLFRQRAAVNGDKGFLLRGLALWIACARISFPVPLWPLISTLTSDCATIPPAQADAASAGCGSRSPAMLHRWGRVLQRAVDGFIKRVFIDRLGQEAEYALLGRGDRIGIEPWAVRIITGMPGCCFWISANSCRPSISSIRRSLITRSIFSRLSTFSPSCPLSAVTTL